VARAQHASQYACLVQVRESRPLARRLAHRERFHREVSGARPRPPESTPAWIRLPAVEGNHREAVGTRVVRPPAAWALPRREAPLGIALRRTRWLRSPSLRGGPVRALARSAAWAGPALGAGRAASVTGGRI